MSAEENGQTLGECSSGCDEDRGLHLGGGQDTGDQGAIRFGQAYYGCGHANCASTYRRIVLPFIDGSVYSNIEIRSEYLMSAIDQVGGLTVSYNNAGCRSNMFSGWHHQQYE